MGAASWPEPAEAAVFIARIEKAQAALDESVAELTDSEAAAASRLPGWSRGHVLTHLARHADATSRMVEGAQRGELAPQYVGGAAGRAAEIERGASRSAAELIADLRGAGERCGRVLRSTTPLHWAERIGSSGEFPATKALVSRWREIEIHRVDLDLGYHSGDWSAEFVEFFLPQELSRLPERAPGVAAPPGIPDHAVLAWLVGRAQTGAGMPPLPAWG